jgi:ABC-type multidrug transport system ATPase subunit
MRRLDDVALLARPGEMVAVIGASGAGKSTLLAVLAGLLSPTSGEGTVAGADVRVPATERTRRIGTGRIGYVPQRDSLHGELTVEQELCFAVELRHVVNGEGRIDEVLGALGIDDLRERRIRELSGGERKRVNVAVELLAAPDVLLLDEATTGLDPGHERDLTRYLRTLADAGIAIVSATHSVVYLEEYDRVLLLGAGGRVLFRGTPRAALEEAGVSSFVDLFDLDEPFGPAAPADTDTGRPDAPSRPAPVPVGTVGVLVRRQLRRLVQDRRTLAFLALQAPVLGLMVRAITGPDGLGLGAISINLYARRVLLVLVLCAVWLGSIFAIREIVHDRGVLAREQVAGVTGRQVLAARLITLTLITGVQVLVLTLVGCAGIRTTTPQALLLVIVSLWLCAEAAGCLALAVSALVRNTDQALAVLPLVLVPQIVLSGGVLSLADVPALRVISYVSPARWGLSAVASASHLREIETSTVIAVPLSPTELSIARHEDADTGWDPTALAWGTDLIVLAGLCAAGAAVTGLGLRRA